jgi:hypothetical protein
MALLVINVGTRDMDATGDPIQLGFTKTNENFVSLFAGTGVTPLLVNTSITNNMQGDDAYVAFGKINANFAYLFSLPSYAGGIQQVINIGSGPYNGIIGLADPGVLAWIKINENFAYLASPANYILLDQNNNPFLYAYNSQPYTTQ